MNKHIVAALAALAAAGCGDFDVASSGGAPIESAQPAPVAQTFMQPGRYVQWPDVALSLDEHRLVADAPGAADKFDPNVVNAWGVAFGPNGGAWVAGRGADRASLYDADGTARLKVIMPESAPAPAALVYNDDPTAFGGDSLIVVTGRGAVLGWRPEGGAVATVRADIAPNRAAYTGAAIAHIQRRPFLYVADFLNREVVMFDRAYTRFEAPGGFRDVNLPSEFAPFNVFAYHDVLLVAYAKRAPDGVEDFPGAGNGYVNLFDAKGYLIQRVVTRAELNSPWGMAVAPDGFGHLAGRFLVGNSGDGRINVYKIGLAPYGLRADFEGPLGDAQRRPIVIDGLRAIAFGPGAAGFEANALYFTAGPGGGLHGVFGRLTPR